MFSRTCKRDYTTPFISCQVFLKNSICFYLHYIYLTFANRSLQISGLAIVCVCVAWSSIGRSDQWSYSIIDRVSFAWYNKDSGGFTLPLIEREIEMNKETQRNCPKSINEYLDFKMKQWMRLNEFDSSAPEASDRLKKAIHPQMKDWIAEAIAAGCTPPTSEK
jgi:hypothetical protein